MRFGELFAGAGGMSMGLEQSGHRCVWHADTGSHAAAVLRHRWPTTPLLGDVRGLHGQQLVDAYGPIDLLSGGSPCQDLSLAGDRAGLAGDRSALFHEQCRLWRETGAPLMLWENVAGALSSNGGADFTAILGGLGATDIARPNTGWPSAGVVYAHDGSPRVAYRTLDLRWFGPPQRRRRVFLLVVAEDAVRQYDPAAILFADVRHPRSPGRGTVLSVGEGDDRVPAPEWGDDAPDTGVLDASVRCLACGIYWEPEGALEGCPVCGAAPSWASDVCNTLSDGAHYGGGLNGQDVLTGRLVVAAGRPRRLTPTECERLMGWPAQHTATGVTPTGKVYALPDAARYRLCANGVGSPCAHWIGNALAWWETTHHTSGPLAEVA